MNLVDSATEESAIFVGRVCLFAEQRTDLTACLPLKAATAAAAAAA